MKGRPVTTMEDPAPYRADPTDRAEPPLATEDLVAHHQGIPDDGGDYLLWKRPERLRARPITPQAARPAPARGSRPWPP